MIKVIVAALVACIEDDRDRHRYRLEYGLVRADGIGEWASAVDDILTGPASQVLAEEVRAEQRALTQKYRLSDPDWQPRLVQRLDEARRAIDPTIDQLPRRVEARRWFSDFAALRNRTRGHGATTAAACTRAAPPLNLSLELLAADFPLFRRSWVHLRRNLSGKYRVTSLGVTIDPFETLKSDRTGSYADGIHIHVGRPRPVTLLAADDDIRDFFLPNGRFTGRRYELLSYLTDTRIADDATRYSDPPTTLPASETEGLGELTVVGNVFTNIPDRISGYIDRPELEGELAQILMDDRHPVVTLVGRGGIGKTSLALSVLHTIAERDRFFGVIWFSARDIELLPRGPKLVRPRVLSPEDMAGQYVSLLQPAESGEPGFAPQGFFADALGNTRADPMLFVFDNFETVRNPLDMYRWLDTYIRLPNKVLITTRSREFRGDYWLEVGGMTEDQFSALVRQTASRFGVDHLISAEYEAELYRETDGHPYLGKVMLGELARSRTRQKVTRIMASQDRMLEALFERTFSQLSPAAQRLFFTLSNWRSLVPLIALAAAVTRPENERIDVDAAVDELHRSSLIELTHNLEREVFLSVPLSASIFGRRKLETSPMKPAVDADTEFLHLFGPVQATDTDRGLSGQVLRLFGNVAERLQRRPQDLDRYLPILEYVAREQPVGWVLLAQLYDEQRLTPTWRERAAAAYRSYLEVVPDDAQVWRKLAQMCTLQEDYLGAVLALIQRAKLPEAAYADISFAASRVNSYLQQERLQVDTDEKRVMINSLVEVMESRIAEADATDHSRLAWLLMNIGDAKHARRVVDAGLKLDPTNFHCRKLRQRLE